jgi:ankyrin repeat protein
VRKGADPNARDDLDWYRMPPLTTAALRGHVRAARKLLELGARPDTQDWDQWTALHYAAYIGTARHAEVADMLLAFGADLYETTWNGAPPSLGYMMASLPLPCPGANSLLQGRRHAAMTAPQNCDRQGRAAARAGVRERKG